MYFINRAEEEVASKMSTQKQVREMESTLQDIQEDLDAEKEARNKAEKQKRDLSEVYNSFCFHYHI